jgi:hypothetical protein
VQALPVATATLKTIRTRKGHAETETKPPRRIQQSVSDKNRISVIIIIPRNAPTVKYLDGLAAKSSLMVGKGLGAIISQPGDVPDENKDSLLEIVPSRRLSWL